MLRTTVGGVGLVGCLMNASGCGDTTREQLDELAAVSPVYMGMLVSKSATVEPRRGNPWPRFVLDPNSQESVNSMGLANLGFDFYSRYECKTKPYMLSIHPFSKDELSKMMALLPPTVRMLEINLSCPNIVGADSKGAFDDRDSIRSVLDIVRKYNRHNLTVGLKLPPFFHALDFDRVSNILLEYKDAVKFVTCCNSLPNGILVDHRTEETLIHPKGGLGGIGGPALKPVALANVRQFYLRLEPHIDVVACGGNGTGRDAFESILVGARAVQIGTCLLEDGTDCFAKIYSHLWLIMRSKGYRSIEDFRGKLQVRPPSPSTTPPANDPASAPLSHAPISKL